MSAEPMRRASCSNDLRWRVVWQRLAKGLTYKRIAEYLCISIGTVCNIIKLFEDTGGSGSKGATEARKEVG